MTRRAARAWALRELAAFADGLAEDAEEGAAGLERPEGTKAAREIRELGAALTIRAQRLERWERS